MAPQELWLILFDYKEAFTQRVLALHQALCFGVKLEVATTASYSAWRKPLFSLLPAQKVHNSRLLAPSQRARCFRRSAIYLWRRHGQAKAWQRHKYTALLFPWWRQVGFDCDKTTRRHWQSFRQSHELFCSRWQGIHIAREIEEQGLNVTLRDASDELTMVSAQGP